MIYSEYARRNLSLLLLSEQSRRHSSKKLTKTIYDHSSAIRHCSISRMLDLGGAPSSLTDKNVNRTINASKNCILKSVCFDFDTLTKSIDHSTTATPPPTRTDMSASSSTEIRLGQITPDVSKIEHIASLLNVNLNSGGGGDNDEKGHNRKDSRDDDDLSLLTGEKQSSPPLETSSSIQQVTNPLLSNDIRAKYATKLSNKGVPGGVASVEYSKQQAESALKRGDAAGHLAARKMVASSELVLPSNDASTSSSTRWMAQTGTGNLLQYLTQRSIQIALLPSRPLAAQVDEEESRHMLALQRQLQDVVFDLLVRDGTLSPSDILHDALQTLHQQPAGSLLVSSRDEYLRAAKELGWMTCRIRPKNAPRGNISTNYMVESVPDVKHVVDEINGISYSAVMKGRS